MINALKPIKTRDSSDFLGKTSDWTIGKFTFESFGGTKIGSGGRDIEYL